MNEDTQKDTLTVEEAAKRLGVSRGTAYESVLGGPVEGHAGGPVRPGRAQSRHPRSFNFAWYALASHGA